VTEGEEEIEGEGQRKKDKCALLLHLMHALIAVEVLGESKVY
jgi:hypothetical protein